MTFEYFEAESHVSTYNKFRPNPPKELIEEIVKFTSQKFSGPLKLAVDVGCGSGQSTEILSPYFEKVLGFDPSEQIIAEAKKKCCNSNVFYSTCSAEETNLKDESVTLITTVQAVHWFDLNKFYSEANRILCKDGVLAIYGYELPVPALSDKEEEFAALIKRYYTEVLGDYVLPESRKVYLEKYSSPEFNEIDFIEGGKMIRKENFIAELDADVETIAGYVESWSGFQNYRKHKGNDEGEKVLNNFRNDLKALIGPFELLKAPLKFRFSYFLLMGRKQ